MDINLSKTAETKIRRIAKSRGRDIADVAGELLEERVLEIELDKPPQKTLADMSGMFYGGPGDTAERSSEILRAEFGVEKAVPK